MSSSQSLQRELGQLIDPYQRFGLDIDLQELFDAFLTMVREQGLAIPSDYVVLLTTLAMLEGVAKHMAPDYRLTDTVAAYAHSAVDGRLSPEQLMTGAHRTMARYKHLLDDLPVGLSRALRRASEGEFRVAVRPTDYDRLLDRAISWRGSRSRSCWRPSPWDPRSSSPCSQGR